MICAYLAGPEVRVASQVATNRRESTRVEYAYARQQWPRERAKTCVPDAPLICPSRAGGEKEKRWKKTLKRLGILLFICFFLSDTTTNLHGRSHLVCLHRQLLRKFNKKKKIGTFLNCSQREIDVEQQSSLNLCIKLHILDFSYCTIEKRKMF